MSTAEQNSSQQTTPNPSAERRLPLRDWVLLPFLSVLTIALLAGSTEWFARHHFSESKTSTLTCLNVSDPQFGVSAHPNTVCSQKMRESELVEFRFNNCGLRTNHPCTPAPEGTYRIALLGSSLAEGMWVPQPETFAALLPDKLSTMTGRKVDLYNLAMQWETPRNAASRIDQTIAAKPDLVIWQLGPFDVDNATLKLPYIPGKQVADDGTAPQAPTEATPTGFVQRIRAAAQRHGSLDGLLSAAWSRISEPLNETATVFLVKHYLYKSQSQFLRQYLANSPSSGFLHKQTPPEIQTQLGHLNGYLDEVATRLKAANIPLMIVFLPNRPQADMVASGSWPATDDPYHLEDEVRQMALAHGAKFVEVLHDFQGISNPDRLYFPVDGHLTPAGQGVIADLLAKKLTNGVIPELRVAPSASGAQGDK
ncbi:SGNH/GDSL hydrolase family protein [Silvibacterium dinghuense]|uniref:SGNH hydrolase-type esterase domain-containing protein n=1 Tax=Silvibacterium dinghuense TaxID=1560006 RepID=A0A4V1NVR0_9BACT|nr:GDSL-type esterase/lipase family protein [Silvibacterium dinghuense]RXS96792.1 hypothetical protein ESZ00_02245 [Silvibacterium dinghuense]GGG93676.1 hypothetical protein GCM10011586_05560 [Silvibacterium dinghuense]